MGCMYACMYVCMHENECILYYVCMDGWMEGCREGGMDGWMDGWMGRWMDGWMERWNGLTVTKAHPSRRASAVQMVVLAVPGGPYSIIEYRAAPAGPTASSLRGSPVRCHKSGAMMCASTAALSVVRSSPSPSSASISRPHGPSSGSLPPAAATPPSSAITAALRSAAVASRIADSARNTCHCRRRIGGEKGPWTNTTFHGVRPRQALTRGRCWDRMPRLV